MHFGSGPVSGGDDDQEIDSYDASDDPFIVEDHLIELGECHKFSKSVFFIVSSTFYHSCNYPNTLNPAFLMLRWQSGCKGEIFMSHYLLSTTPDTPGHGNRKSDPTDEHQYHHIRPAPRTVHDPDRN